MPGAASAVCAEDKTIPALMLKMRLAQSTPIVQNFPKLLVIFSAVFQRNFYVPNGSTLPVTSIRVLGIFYKGFYRGNLGATRACWIKQ